MEIFVYSEAYVGTEDYVEIKETKVFTDIVSAQEYLKEQVESYLNHPEDGDKWKVNCQWPDYAFLIYNGYEDEVVMQIDKHKI